ncbi:MAG TPA: hypothetical protein VMT69_06285 [Kineosporiaceae bacterium]|nr:hypothetical protein [Kineosporiaceae bacterium]
MAPPAHNVVAGRAIRLTRAVTVHAASPLVYRWVCQLTQAPYSYDLLDNAAGAARASSRPARTSRSLA